MYSPKPITVLEVAKGLGNNGETYLMISVISNQMIARFGLEGMVWFGVKIGHAPPREPGAEPSSGPRGEARCHRAAAMSSLCAGVPRS